MQRNLPRSLVLMIGLGASGLAMAQDNTTTGQMTLSSPAFKDMEPLPLKYTQTGTRPSIVVSPGMNNAAVNPPIEWSNAPPGTNAFVLMLYDHVDTLMWAVVNIPGDVRSLSEAIPNGNQSSKLPAGLFIEASAATAGLDRRPGRTRRVAGRIIGSFIPWTRN